MVVRDLDEEERNRPGHHGKAYDGGRDAYWAAVRSAGEANEYDEDTFFEEKADREREAGALDDGDVRTMVTHQNVVTARADDMVCIEAFEAAGGRVERVTVQAEDEMCAGLDGGWLRPLIDGGSLGVSGCG